MEKIKKILVVAVLALTLVGIFALHVALPDGTVSDAERRPLAQLPELTADGVFSGDYFEELEEYLLDLNSSSSIGSVAARISSCPLFSYSVSYIGRVCGSQKLANAVIFMLTPPHLPPVQRRYPDDWNQSVHSPTSG